jgi:hypothetical protein
MPTIRFSYAGQKFKTEVPEGFRDLPEETQRNRILTSLNAKYGDKPAPAKEDKNILDYIALIERPSQAIKVGLKESTIGGALYRSLGGVDLTPSEGFLTGFGKGWMGKDEIRTQDALPDDMNPILKGVLGFAGDVATDPLTYFGPAAVRAAGAGIKKASDVTGATPMLQKAGEAVLEAPILPESIKGGRTVRDALRAMNVATGQGKKVKGLASISDRNEFQDRVRIALSTGVDDLERFFNNRAEQLGVGVDEVKKAFRTAMERENVLEDVIVDGEVQYLRQMDGSPLLDPKTGKRIKAQRVQREDGSPVRKPVGTAQERILGDEGVRQVNAWGDLFDEASKYSAAYGQPIREITSKGYFPRVVKSEWKDIMDDLKVVELDETDPIKPIYGTNYRGERLAYRDDAIDDASRKLKQDYLERYDTEIGGPKNPADVEFFELDPIVAMGSRLDRQARALQRKWFIDEITDSGYGIGSMLSRSMVSDLITNYNKSYKGTRKAYEDGKISRHFLDEIWALSKGETRNWNGSKVTGRDMVFKPERDIGKWVRQRGETYEVRELNPSWRGRLDKDHPQFQWRPMSKQEQRDFLTKDKYEVVEGIPTGYVSTGMYNERFDHFFEVFAKDQGNLRADIVEEIIASELRDPDEIALLLRQRIPNIQKGTLAEYNSVVMNADKAAKKILDEAAMETEKFYAPQAIRRQIEDTLDVMSGPKRDNDFINFYDKLQNTWKSWSLGVRPAYHSRNAIGNMWNAYMVAGVYSVQPFVDAAKLQYYGRFGGSEARRRELIDNMGGVKGPLHDLSKIKDKEWTQEFAGTGFTMQQLYDGARMRGVTAGHYTKDTIREMELALAVKTGEGSFFQRFIGPENPLVRGGFAVGGTIEGNARFGVFLNTINNIRKNPSKYEWTAPDGTKHKLSDGVPEGYFKTETEQYRDRFINNNIPITKDDMIMDVASQEVKAALFDYGDVSRFEQNVLKRFMPFYTWSRKNIPAQFKALIQNPERAEKLAIAKQQFEHETGEMDYTDYGKFWGDRVPVFFGNESEGVVKAFTLLNLLPMADLQRMIKPQELVADLVTPLIKQPLEQLANYDTFMKRAIKSYPGETEDFLGVKLPPRLHHLAKLLVPLSDINRLNPAGVFGENIQDPVTGVPTRKTDAYFGLGTSRESYKDVNESARWIRFFSGVPTYDVNLKRTKYFMNKNLKKDLAELKGRIKWAARKGENRKMEDLMRLIEAVEKGETIDPFERRS